MPDLADLAQLQTERLALLPRPAVKSGPEATGFCLYCDEPVAPGLRWCNAECRNDWQAEENRRQHQGSTS